MARGISEDATEHRTRRRVLKMVVGVAALATAGSTNVSAQASDGDFTTTDYEIESFDGTELGTTLYEPTSDGPHPAMLMTHGYGLTRNISPFVITRARLYARNGYATLTYDSRGFGDSGGQVNVDGPKEVKDAQTLITWLANRENVLTDSQNDPRIGMDGTSYGGGIQLNTAAAEGRGDGVSESDDRLDAIVPRWAWNDLTYSLGPNGVIKRNWAAFLVLLGTVTGSLFGDDPIDYVQTQTPELYEILLEGLTQNRLTEEAQAFFDARSPSQDVEGITAPTLLIQGWPDTLFTPLETVWTGEGLDDAEFRYIFSNGGHSTELLSSLPQQEYLNQQALEWIDTHLRGDGASDLPGVTYYERQSGDWSTADDLPPADADSQTLSLAAAAADEETFVFNSVLPTSTSQLFPVNADTSVTSVDFDFDVEEGGEILGVPQLTLTVEPLGPESRLFTKFYHVHDGEATLINNQVTPVKVEGEPKSTQEVEVEMVPFQRRVEPGDTLRFTVATTDLGFQSSRESAGACIQHSEENESAVDVPAVGGSFGGSQKSENDSETSTLRIEGSGSWALYSFAVTGEVDNVVTDGDPTTNNRASGSVSGGHDEYEFTGSLQNLSVRGDATVLVNDREVTPSEY
jgi:ABC-2 type transport system ATP-binding protein